ncbi:MAG: twin-arginine translocation signal domain-containing protein [Planctomycetes bacterium]|nr:twin-arginine translocation signal domain-containing protein [Planctomycetota bacterium]
MLDSGLTRRDFLVAGTAGCAALSAAPVLARDSDGVLDNNLQVVDLSDLKQPLPLTVNSTKQILKQTEDWEHSSYKNSNWPAGGHQSIGYPSVVRNVHGKSQDGQYFLFYAHHDPMSGIGCAIADSIRGPFVKLADLPGPRGSTAAFSPFPTSIRLVRIPMTLRTSLAWD